MTKEQSNAEVRSLFHAGSDELDAPNPALTAKDPTTQEVNLVLDETLFDIIGSESEVTKEALVAPSLSIDLALSPVETQHLSTLDADEPSFYRKWKNEQRKKYGDEWKPNPVLPSPPAEPERDFYAELQEWLATTKSIEFID